MKIIFLPGFAGAPEDWDGVVRYLSPSFKIETFAYSDGMLIENIKSRLLAETDPYALVGYSMGGRLALAALAGLQKDNLPRAIILLSSGMNESDTNSRAARLLQDEKWAKSIRDDIASFWGDWYAQPLFASLKELPTEQLQAWHNRRKNMPPDRLAQQIVENSPGRLVPLRPQLQALIEERISILYISGDLDKKYSMLSATLKHEFPSIITATIPGSGHILPLEAPEECAFLIRDFLERQRR